MSTQYKRQATAGVVVGAETILLRDFRIAFEIEKSLEEKSNGAKVTVYNLAANTAKRSGAATEVFLTAGYVGGESIAFKGAVKRVEDKSDGAGGRATTFVLADGSKTAAAHFSISLKPGDGIRAALEAILRQLKLRGTLPAEIENTLLNIGLAFSGRATELLGQLLTDRGYEYFVEDETVRIVKKGEATPDAAVLLTYRRGLLQTERTEKGIKVTTLLNPLIRPGRALTVDAARFNGTFRAEKVKHTGDTHGADWKTEAEGAA